MQQYNPKYDVKMRVRERERIRKCLFIHMKQEKNVFRVFAFTDRLVISWQRSTTTEELTYILLTEELTFILLRN